MTQKYLFFLKRSNILIIKILKKNSVIVFLRVNCAANLLTGLIKNISLKNKFKIFVVCYLYPTNTLKKCLKNFVFCTFKINLLIKLKLFL